MVASGVEFTNKCPCHGNVNKSEGFHKVIELKDYGMVIFCHTTPTYDVNKTKPSQDVVIIHNTNNMNMTSGEVLQELDKNKITCPRCRQILRHTQELLNKSSGRERRNVIGVCGHCRLKSQSHSREPCTECENVIKKFLALYGRQQKQDPDKYTNLWNKDSNKLYLNKKLSFSDMDLHVLKPDIEKPIGELKIKSLFHSADSLSQIEFVPKRSRKQQVYIIDKETRETIEIFRSKRSDSSITLLSDNEKKKEDIDGYDNMNATITSDPDLIKERSNIKKRMVEFGYDKEEIEFATNTRQAKLTEYKKLIQSQKLRFSESEITKDISFFFPGSQPELRKPRGYVSTADVIMHTREKMLSGANKETKPTDEKEKLEKEKNEKEKLEKEKLEKEKLEKEKLEQEKLEKDKREKEKVGKDVKGTTADTKTAEQDKKKGKTTKEEDQSSKQKNDLLKKKKDSAKDLSVSKKKDESPKNKLEPAKETDTSKKKQEPPKDIDASKKNQVSSKDTDVSKGKQELLEGFDLRAISELKRKKMEEVLRAASLPQAETLKKVKKKKPIKQRDIKKKAKPDQTDDLLLRLMQLKRAGNGDDEIYRLLTQDAEGPFAVPSIAELPVLDIKDLDNAVEYKNKELHDVVVGENLTKYRPPLIQERQLTSAEKRNQPQVFQTEYKEEDPLALAVEQKKEPPKKIIEPDKAYKGIMHYALSDRTFVEKGWTMLPTEKIVRKMNVYRMRPAQPKFDWFERNKNKRVMLHHSGEKLAEFDDNGRGRWYYKNGRLALDYYDAQETNCQQRFVVYSSGEPDERGRCHPITILATFDYLGNGIVFDHTGKIRLKYNQTEGVVLDRNIGPVSHWKWHTLNDPPVLQKVMIDTQMSHKDPVILKLGNGKDHGEHKSQAGNEEMLAIEFDNFIKEKSKKVSPESYKPFQIKMKALKMNEHFSLKVLDQASVYLIFRDGPTNLRINIGMVLDVQEIVDTDTAEVGEVSNSLERFPARTDSLDGLQRSIAYAQHYERTRTERERRTRPTVPCASADKLVAAASRPQRPPFKTVPATPGESTSPGFCRCARKPSNNNVYYNSRLM